MVRWRLNQELSGCLPQMAAASNYTLEGETVAFPEGRRLTCQCVRTCAICGKLPDKLLFGRQSRCLYNNIREVPAFSFCQSRPGKNVAEKTFLIFAVDLFVEAKGF